MITMCEALCIISSHLHNIPDNVGTVFIPMRHINKP